MPNTEMRQLPIRLPAELYDTLKGVAYFTGRSMNQIAVAAIESYLETEEVGGTAVRAIVEQAQEDYRGALDKLKDM